MKELSEKQRKSKMKVISKRLKKVSKRHPIDIDHYNILVDEYNNYVNEDEYRLIPLLATIKETEISVYIVNEEKSHHPDPHDSPEEFIENIDMMFL